MKKLLLQLLGQKVYAKAERWKKKIFPTQFDREQHKAYDAQLNFYSQFIKPSDLCFDIGANVGLKTAIFLQLQANVISIEPQEQCIAILKNKFGERATILKKGVGAISEKKEFYISNNPQLSSFDGMWVNEMKDGRFKGSEIQAIEQIHIITLDSLIEIYGSPDFIKIDVEGYEKEVLKGLTKLFKNLSFEYAVPEKLHEVITCLKILQNKYENLICNYAVGNNASNLTLEKWISINDMIYLVQQDKFISTDSGDIYIQLL